MTEFASIEAKPFPQGFFHKKLSKVTPASEPTVSFGKRIFIGENSRPIFNDYAYVQRQTGPLDVKGVAMHVEEFTPSNEELSIKIPAASAFVRKASGIPRVNLEGSKTSGLLFVPDSMRYDIKYKGGEIIHDTSGVIGIDEELRNPTLSQADLQKIRKQAKEIKKDGRTFLLIPGLGDQAERAYALFELLDNNATVFLDGQYESEMFSLKTNMAMTFDLEFTEEELNWTNRTSQPQQKPPEHGVPETTPADGNQEKVGAAHEATAVTAPRILEEVREELDDIVHHDRKTPPSEDVPEEKFFVAEKIRGTAGITIRGLNKLGDGGTADVYLSRFIAEGKSAEIPAIFKKYRSERLGDAREKNPWTCGPAEACVLSLRLPGMVEIYDAGWTRGQGTLLSTLPDGVLPEHTALLFGTALPSFGITMELLDKKTVVMRPWDLMQSSFYEHQDAAHALQRELLPQEELGDALLISAAYIYANTKAEAQKKGWDVRDFEPEKNFALDTQRKMWRTYDFGIADPAFRVDSTEAVRNVDDFFGKPLAKEITDREKERFNSTPDIPEETGRKWLKSNFIIDAIRPRSYATVGTEENRRPAEEKLTPKLKEFVTWVLDQSDNVTNMEELRDHVGRFIVERMGPTSLAVKLVNNTMGEENYLQKAA